MIHLDDEAVADSLPWPALIDAIERAVAGGADAAPRQNLVLTGADGEQGRLLVMPAWQGDETIGVKLVTYWGGNGERGLPTHGASYVLLDARSGHVRAVMAAEALTHRRTAALSVIAARHLLRAGARRLLIIGTGPVAEQLVRAHAASGRFTSIDLFGRSDDRARALVQRLSAAGIACHVVSDLEDAVGGADMIASATSATAPFLRGEWLAPDAHVDLFGSFTPAMREGDDRLMARAAEIWVDAEGAIEDSGDLIGPLANGAIDRSVIRGDLSDLLKRGRAATGGISVFKSVGIAVADLAAAQLVMASRPSAALGGPATAPT